MAKLDYTWGEALSKFPQGRNGVWMAKVSRSTGKLEGKLPWWSTMVLSLAGITLPAGVVIAIRGAVNILRPKKSWVSACCFLDTTQVEYEVVAGDNIEDNIRFLNVTEWIGPASHRQDTMNNLADALGF